MVTIQDMLYNVYTFVCDLSPSSQLIRNDPYEALAEDFRTSEETETKAKQTRIETSLRPHGNAIPIVI